MAGADDRRAEAELEGMYRTKVVEVFGRCVPIILQNDNGPCPLIAICNVLLLRNIIHLSSEDSEVPLKKLLSLIAERLLDSNSSIQDEDAGYAKNQQQNIHDAIEMLPRLATGIDVNLHFRKIGDFEFTPERAIFDLLGIELYHGWIVDPQDTNTLNAIGSKSYNAIMAEIVFLEQRNAEKEDKSVLEEYVIDFAAATTATLGVPSPCLARVKSFDDAPVPGVGDYNVRRGDKEEEEELLRALELSKADLSTSSNHISRDATFVDPTLSDAWIKPEISESSLLTNEDKSLEASSVATVQNDTDNIMDKSNCEESANGSTSIDLTAGASALLVNQNVSAPCDDGDAYSVTKVSQKQVNDSLGNHMDQTTCLEVEHRFESFDVRPGECLSNSDDNLTVSVCTSSPKADPSTADGESKLEDVSGVGVAPQLEHSEPMYEGEETILDPGHQIYENREPMYEGEMVLAEQADRETESGSYPQNDITKKGGKNGLCISSREGELIQNFLRSNASQLTVYGLFCLQEGLKEHELCVFFRNNHFSTMYKFDGELYLLVTDQGYLNQPGLVWEKLNEVNGDSVFYTGKFTVYTAENQATTHWDEQNAMASTADYLANIDHVEPEGSTFNADLRMAIELQQQEFEQQQQQQQRRPQQQQPPRQQSRQQQYPATGASRLVTGPQGPRSGGGPSKPDGKSKDKCGIM